MDGPHYGYILREILGRLLGPFRHISWDVLYPLIRRVAGMVIGAILIAAIGQTSAPTGTTYTNGAPTVHMSAGNFSQPSVTIPKGSNLLYRPPRDEPGGHCAIVRVPLGILHRSCEFSLKRMESLDLPVKIVQKGCFLWQT